MTRSSDAPPLFVVFAIVFVIAFVLAGAATGVWPILSGGVP